MTRTVAETFTLTHAKHLASKVTADLKRCQQMYGKPSDLDINNYGTELALLLRDGYLGEFECGFKGSDGKRILTLKYTVDSAGDLSANDRPGGIVSHVDVSGASWYSFLSYSSSWSKLSVADQAKVEAELPITRTTGNAPPDGDGYWTNNKSYSASGVAMIRKDFRPN